MTAGNNNRIYIFTRTQLNLHFIQNNGHHEEAFAILYYITYLLVLHNLLVLVLHHLLVLHNLFVSVTSLIC